MFPFCSHLSPLTWHSEQGKPATVRQPSVRQSFHVVKEAGRRHWKARLCRGTADRPAESEVQRVGSVCLCFIRQLHQARRNTRHYFRTAFCSLHRHPTLLPGRSFFTAQTVALFTHPTVKMADRYSFSLTTFSPRYVCLSSEGCGL